jgi:nitrite reductase [NAD(P)H] small subunit
VHGTSVTCPLHNWVLSLETGEAQGADEGRALAFLLRVKQGRILLDLSALADRPALGKAS